MSVDQPGRTYFTYACPWILAGTQWQGMKITGQSKNQQIEIALTK
jgi:hypothetical protein